MEKYFISKNNDTKNPSYFTVDKETGKKIGFLIAKDSSDIYCRFAEYCNGKKLMSIIIVYVQKDYIGNGIGTALINKLLKDYKDYNILLIVNPMMHKTLSKEELYKFYEKFGFVRTNELVCTMIKKAEQYE